MIERAGEPELDSKSERKRQTERLIERERETY